MQNLRILGIILLSVLTVSSCSYRTKDILFKTDKKLTSSKPVAAFGETKNDSAGAYKHRIKPGDRLQIRFLNNYDMGQAAAQSATSMAERNGNDNGYLVNYDSTVTLPLIGRTNLVGMTRLEAAKELENLYSQFIINPIIDVNIANLSVTILGEVKKPGKVNIDKETTTLIDAVALAGGLTDGGKKNNVKIIRGREVILVNLKNINALYEPGIVLQDNDIIYVEPYRLKALTDPLATTRTFLFFMQTILIGYNFYNLLIE